MTQPYNIGQHYGEIATANADYPALIGNNIALSHGQLWQVANTLASHLAEDGVGPGSIVVLNSNAVVVVLSTLLATGILGSGFVIANKALAQAKVVQPTHFYRTADLSGHPDVPFRIFDLDWLRLDKRSFKPHPPAVNDPDAPWMYMHTSGTTGAPKFIALSQRTILERSQAASIDFPYRETSFATTFPCTSRPFFARALAALFQACAIVVGEDTDNWLENGVNFVAGSPAQMSKLFDGRTLPRKIARLEVSGARLPAGAAASYLRSFARVIDVYGASETSKSFANELTLSPQGTVIAHGLLLDSEVEIVNSAGRPCQEGEVGSVRVRNGYMAQGYLFAPRESERAMKDGWFYPGDLAQWSETGALMILGREDDVINLGGFKLHGSLIDGLIGNIDGVKEAIAFKNPIPGATDALIAFVVYEDISNRYMVNVKIVAQVMKSFGFGISERNLKMIAELPRDEFGSPDRQKCAEMTLQRARNLGEIS